MDSTKQSLDELNRALNYAYTTYLFFLELLPSEEAFANGKRVRVGKYEIQQYTHAQGMGVELGWAFFTRLEAALEAHVNRIGIKGKDVPPIVDQSKDLSQNEKHGYKIAREIRNIFHHGDGDGNLLRDKPAHVKSPVGEEPHLYPKHIADFTELFFKIGSVLVRHATEAA